MRLLKLDDEQVDTLLMVLQGATVLTNAMSIGPKVTALIEDIDEQLSSLQKGRSLARPRNRVLYHRK